MKALSVPGLFLLLLSLASGLYNKFIYAPKICALEEKYNEFSFAVQSEIRNLEVLIDKMIIITAIAGFILCIVPAIKTKTIFVFMAVICALGAVSVV